MQLHFDFVVRNYQNVPRGTFCDVSKVFTGATSTVNELLIGGLSELIACGVPVWNVQNVPRGTIIVILRRIGYNDHSFDGFPILGFTRKSQNRKEVS